MEVREPIKWFSEKMEEKLRLENGKFDWRHCNALYLIDCMEEKLDELETVANLYKKGWCSAEEVIQECVDIANYAMMLADNTTHVMSTRERQKKEQTAQVTEQPLTISTISVPDTYVINVSKITTLEDVIAVMKGLMFSSEDSVVATLTPRQVEILGDLVLDETKS